MLIWLIIRLGNCIVAKQRQPMIRLPASGAHLHIPPSTSHLMPRANDEPGVIKPVLRRLQPPAIKLTSEATIDNDTLSPPWSIRSPALATASHA